MAKQNSVIIDPGHGGSDPGAVYGNRREKDDTLALSYDIGNALERRGVRVEYTRVGDVYNSPYEKAQIGNSSTAGSVFVDPSECHGGAGVCFRNSEPDLWERWRCGDICGEYNKKLAAVGWNDLGISERPNLVVLRDTALPAVLVEVGFIDNEKDNDFFDENMSRTADAIADGIVQTFAELEKQTAGEEMPGFYMVQTGIYRVRGPTRRGKWST